MTALQLIAQLRELGIRISAVDGELELDAPAGALTPELKRQLVARKPELLRLLSWSRRSGRSAALPLVTAERNGPLPLSWAQQRLWFLDQLEPGSSAYNISWTVRLRGELRVDLLQQAFDQLVARHESLRTGFPARDGVPEQHISQSIDVSLQAEDLTGAGDEQLRARMARLAAQPFDLSRAPLLRAHLLRLGDAEHILLVVIHHIVSDGASMRVLFRELAACYEALLEDRPVELPELPVQYADFAVWQRNWLDGEELERQVDYWTERLGDAPPLLELPWDRPRAAAMRYRGASVLRVLPAALAGELRALARSRGCTLYMLMLAAFYVLLMRYSGREDLVVGTPMGGRPRAELEGLIGFFINTVVLRADLAGNPAFTELLDRVRDVALEAHANQELPFEKLVEVLEPERELSYSPVFQVMFDLQEEPRWRLPVRKLEVIPEVVFSSRTSSFDLTLSVRQAENGLDAMFEYDTDLFDELTIERMAAQYQALLEEIVAAPATPIRELPLLNDAARQQLVATWGQLSVSYPATATLISLFEQRAAEQPDAPAVIAGDSVCSYAELNRRANRLAWRLQAAGVGSGATVAVCTDRSLGNIAAVLAVLKTGACLAPLDPAYPAARLALMLRESGAAYLLRDAAGREVLGDSVLPATLKIVELDEQVFIDPDYAARNLQSGGAPDDLACLLFTSGSTGVPKAVELQHRGLVNYVHHLALKTGLQPHDRILQFASPAFDISFEEIFTALNHGAALVLREAGMNDSINVFLDVSAQREVSWLSLPTAWWHELCAVLEMGVTLPDCIRSVVIGGERVQPGAFRAWRQHVSDQVQLFNTYGPTEASIAATWCELTHYPADGSRELPIGHPVPNAYAWVLDENLQPLPVGVPGELYIGGVGVARGYRGSAAEGSAQFVADPFAEAAGRLLYRTGDRARYLPDGQLAFMGRVDGQVKVRGHRIEPGEIETALRGFEGVVNCAVILLDERLVAYVVGEADATDLRTQLRAVLPEYMVPAAFVSLDELPLTANGKLDRRALPEPDLQRDTTTRFVAPRSELEQKLADIWSDVLGIERIGVEDDFFALGGHSLIATRVVARIQDRLGMAVPLRALFNEPTVAGLAARLEASDAGADTLPLQPRPANDELPPLSWAQERLWVLEQLESVSAAYHLPWSARLTGRLDHAALQAAANELIRRHESLRTVFGMHEGEPVQLIAPDMPLTVAVEHGRGWDDEHIDARLQELVGQPFDLHTGPLLRVHVLQLDNDDAVLLLVMHHIVSDGWSMGVLFRELAALYDAEVRQQPTALEPLPVQYADYAVWQRAWLSGAELDRQVGYWSQQLEGAPPLLELPLDHPRPPVQRYRGAWVNQTFSPELLAGLRDLAVRENCTLFMVLLAAFKVLLARYTGVEDIVVGTPIAGRRRTELEGLIGFFLNTLALRTDVSGNPDFAEVLARVRTTTLDAYEHQELPFEKLLEVLQPVRSTAHTPVVQVMFNLHNEPASGLSLAGLSVQPFSIDRGTAKFDLSVALVESSAGLQAGFEYNTDLFERETVELMLRHYGELLWAVARDSSQRIAGYALTSADVLPVPQSRKPADFGGAGNLVDAFEYAVGRYADRPAVHTSDVEWTYNELDARANAVAACVNSTAAERVGLLLGHDAPMLAGLLGVLKAGRAYVPLDPASPARRLRSVIHEAGLQVVLCDARYRSLLADVPDIELLTLPDESAEAAPDVAVAANDLAYVLFTSGSTGKPKGVMQTQRNVLHHARVYSESLDIGPADRLTLLSGYGFDAAVMDIFGALLNGACLYPLSLRDEEYAGELLDRMGEDRITILHSTPTVFRHLMRNKVCRHDLTCVRYVVLGGEEALSNDFALFRRQFAPPTRFVNGLGPSESTLALQFFADHATRLPGHVVPVGLPVEGTDIRLVNADGSEAGICGELVIRSRHVSPGYWRLPELTAERFLPDPEEEGVYLYRTGDRARYLPDGRLVFIGRIDDQVKVRGHRIEPGEIEAAAESLAGVDRCAVVLRDDRLIAYLVGSADVATVREELRGALPDYMVPAAFVTLDELPLTSNGKLDKRALPEPAMTRDERELYVEPRNDIERQLVAIWSEVLGVERIGVHDDFFALGGHSLMAAQLVARVTESLQVGLPIRRLFDTPTIAGIAEHVDTLRWALAPDDQP